MTTATQRPRLSRQQRKRLKFLWTPVIAVALFLFLLPIFWIIATSFKPTVEMFAMPATLLPDNPTLEHFQAIIDSGDIVKLFRNSLFVATCTTLICLVIGIPAAYGFARHPYRMSGVLLGAFLVIRMFPPVALALPFFLQFRRFGLINTPLGLVVAYLPIVLPLVVWMIEGFFRQVPEEVIEAAKIDGLGVIRTLVMIVIPISGPAVATAGLFGFLVSWNELIIALSLTRTPDAQTMPVGISGYITQFQTFWGQMTATSLIYLVPVLIVTVFAQRRVVAGLTGGAVKG